MIYAVKLLEPSPDLCILNASLTSAILYLDLDLEKVTSKIYLILHRVSATSLGSLNLLILILALKYSFLIFDLFVY